MWYCYTAFAFFGSLLLGINFILGVLEIPSRPETGKVRNDDDTDTHRQRIETIQRERERTQRSTWKEKYSIFCGLLYSSFRYVHSDIVNVMKNVFEEFQPSNLHVGIYFSCI